MSDFNTLMQESFDAHQNFKRVWRDWRSGKLKDAKGVKPHSEPQSVIVARNKFLSSNGRLFSSKIEPLERKFRENPKDSLREVIEFLSTDISAFRCGYAKEYFLKLLKQTEFSKAQIGEIQNLLIKVCETNSIRCEFRRWCSLAVKIADKDFVVKLENLVESESYFTRTKSKWILRIINQNRLDLRKK